MAFSLPLPSPFAQQGWKVKIRDKERNEPPHVTILHKKRAWRFDIRSGGFLDAEPDPRDVPPEVVAEIHRQAQTLRQKWDEMYPENPITSKEEDDE